MALNFRKAIKKKKEKAIKKIGEAKLTTIRGFVKDIGKSLPKKKRLLKEDVKLPKIF